MALSSVAAPWWSTDPDLVHQIHADLREAYPTLRLTLTKTSAEVSGTFPVRDEDGRVLDRWAIKISLPADYPLSLPVVREVGGRLKTDSANHVEDDAGTLCVLLPEDRFRSFPVDAPFRVFLDGPLRAFFSSQSFRAQGGEWVHGEWEHGPLAAVRFYCELLGSDDQTVGWRAMIAMARGIEGDHRCPCGARRPVSGCHPDLLAVAANLGREVFHRRLVSSLVLHFELSDGKAVSRFLRALEAGPRGHLPCPCGSGARTRSCHTGLVMMRGVWPIRSGGGRKRR